MLRSGGHVRAVRSARPALRITMALALSLAVAAGCSGDDTTEGTGSTGSSTADTATTQPGGSTSPGDGDDGSSGFLDGSTDDLVFRVVECCDAPAGDDSPPPVPEVSIQGDGTAIVAKSPSADAALPELRQGPIDDAGFVDLVRRALDAGLLEDGVDFGTPASPDLTTTEVTIVYEGTRHVLRAYGLTGTSDDALAGLDDEQRRNRSSLGDLVDAAREATLSADGPFTPDRITVLRMPVPPPPSGTTPTSRPWPLDDPADWPAAAGADGCRTYGGADAAEVTKAAARASQDDLWVTNMPGGEPTTAASGPPVHLVFRPLLPDERDPCRE